MKKIFTFLFAVSAISLVKAGTFGLGDYVWKDDGSQSVLSTNASFVKNDQKPIDLEMGLGMWRYFQTTGNGTIQLQYAVGDANAAPYASGSDGTTQAQSPNYSMTWVTITTDTTNAWALAGASSSLTEGDYTPSGISYYSQIGTFTAGNSLNNIINFGGKAVTSSSSITIDGTQVAGFVSGDYNYMQGAFKYALKPGHAVQPNTTYSFRLITTSANWDGQSANSGSAIADITINYNTYEGGQNQITGGGANTINDGNHYDHGIPVITTGPDILTNTGLPVKWSSKGLQGTVKKNSVLLTWATETEINSSKFIIQRSADGGKSYTDIGTIDSKSVNGNSTSVLTYSFTDASPIEEAVYRVEQIDLDGKVDYSNTVSISLNGVSGKLSVYPNPAISSSLLNVKGVAPGSAYKIVGINGASVAQGILSASNQLNISNLVSGVYILQVSTGNGVFSSVTFIKK